MAIGDLLSIYDADDKHIRNFGEHRDAERKLAITGGLKGLVESWGEFIKSPGGFYNRIVFDTHGNSGRIFFTDEAMYWGGVRDIFGRYNYNKIFPIYTKIYFSGCNVAEGDDGWLFLQEIAKQLCRSGGGVVIGYTSLGIATRFSWPRTPKHFWGDARYVVANPGGVIWDMFESSEVIQQIMRGDPAASTRYQLMQT
jgi:hypothetical protein